MLTAPRFTTIPTRACHQRLEDALANVRPIARGEKHRGAVMAIQAALSDLNLGYLLPAEIDGYFGSRTYSAVEAFQRDYGLAADGMVGRQTMTTLDSLYSGDAVRRPRGLSVHIGVDLVDVAHYGSDMKLDSCVNDAQAMREIAENLGYDAVVYANEEATVTNFSGFLRAAIDELYDGDSLFVTFSGHGSQVPNTSADAETDNLDETLCFYDRMLVDDEFYTLLSQMREGVRVHAVFDSCHSGSVSKDLVQVANEIKAYKKEFVAAFTPRNPEDEDAAAEDQRNRQPFASATASLAKALDGDRPDYAPAPEPKGDLGAAADLFAALRQDMIPTTKNSKQLDTWSRVYERNRSLYDSIKNVVGNKEDQELPCTLISLSACQDNQTTPAGQIFSLFTANILSVWGMVAFTGSYEEFYQQLQNIAPSDASPALNAYGAQRAAARRNDRPFVF